MCNRFFYAIRKAWCFRKQLKMYMNHASLQLANVCDLSRVNLTALGASVVALDYDGVLAAHGEPILRAEIATWLHSYLEDVGPGKQVYIYTNKPSQQRQDYFSQYFPSIKFIWATRKKPYPDGLLQIIAAERIQPKQLLLVDDRLLTGILATAIAGTQGLWITKPYVNYQHRPFAEMGIMLLRILERIGIKCLG